MEALKVTLRQAPEGLSQLWLVITPQSQQQGQGLTIAAYGDPALAEAIVATWRLVSPSVRHGQPTSPAWIYRLGNEVYRADAVGEHSQHVLNLPENADHPCLSDSFLTYTDYDEKSRVSWPGKKGNQARAIFMRAMQYYWAAGVLISETG